ncbi:E3 ubiquitin-protein ligase SIRP1 [Linum perenne]
MEHRQFDTDQSPPPPVVVDDWNSSPHIHATVAIQDVQRQFVQSHDGNLTLIDQNEIEYPCRSMICLGTVGMFQSRPVEFVRQAAEHLTRFGLTEPELWYEYIYELLTWGIEGIDTRTPCGTVPFDLVVYTYADVVWDEQEYMEMEMAMAAEELRMVMALSEEEVKMVPTADTAIGKLLTAVEIGEKENCVICLDELAGGGETAAEMPCRHRFHEGCIVNWLEQSHYCPICRFETPTTEEKMKEEELADLSIEDSDGGWNLRCCIF